MTYKEAIRYLHEHPVGTWPTLEKEVGAFVKEFELTGLIRRGQEKDSVQSYEITQDGREAYEYVYFENRYKPSLFDKFQTALNRLF